MGTEWPAVSAAPAAPAPGVAPASAAAAAGCVMSWLRSSAGAWKSHAGPTGCCRDERETEIDEERERETVG